MQQTLDAVVDFLNTIEGAPETPLHITIGPKGQKTIQVLSETDFKRMFPQHDRKRFSALTDQLKVEIDGIEVVCIVGNVLL